ncbi:MAG: menaquinol oxidoreductase [Deltaproteobacteria bacterium]|nr:MAG: menaquinol oxidoreductase [Deltaproteobacteria bacterium]
MTDFFKLHFFIPLGIVLALIIIPYVGYMANQQLVLGVVIPYLAVLIFLEGLIYRVIKWARSPVPFRIPTTCAQNRSLPWIKKSIGEKLDNPETTLQVIGRMALEVLFFRSLFRNLTTKLRRPADHPEDAKLYYWSYKWLWLGAIAFHYTFLIVLLRHLRFFTETTPGFVQTIEHVDGWFQIFQPTVYLTGIILLAALTYLLLRRVYNPNMRYISLASDYFPLFLIMAIGTTGILMRYFFKVDITAVKQLALGLVTFKPTVPAGIGVIFYIHLFLVSVLFMYFPFSKLLHMAGVFLSPTRNLANNNRWVRHINPWNYPVKFHPYIEHENKYRQAMKEVGLPVEKE